MKMIVAIVNDNASEPVSQSLLDSGFRVTQFATTGGFLRGGATTLMVGVEDQKVEEALQVIRGQISHPEEPENHQATIYVLHVKNFKSV